MVKTDRIYSLQQAANLTGFRLGKFRYSKDKLVAAGATVSDEGWRIPHTTLKAMGWLGIKAPKAAIAEPTALELAEIRVAQLEAENAELKEQLNKRPSFFGRRKK